jgi:hypothetical protein
MLRSVVRGVIAAGAGLGLLLSCGVAVADGDESTVPRDLLHRHDVDRRQDGLPAGRWHACLPAAEHSLHPP